MWIKLECIEFFDSSSCFPAELFCWCLLRGRYRPTWACTYVIYTYIISYRISHKHKPITWEVRSKDSTFRGATMIICTTLMTKLKYRWYSQHMTHTTHLLRIFSTYVLTMYPPCFATLSHYNQCRNMQLLGASMNMNGVSYLSSSKLVHDIKSPNGRGFTHSIQGPSVEDWNEYMDKSESERDNIFSIHCRFLPQGAKEWLARQRHFGWPSWRDLETIIGFGCHLVPVGHPLSPLKGFQWRISFSVAERTLVWYFNHIQIQCYAIMKIILK